MTVTHYHVEACDFGQVLEVWQKQLWPGRISPIEPISCIAENGEINAAILNEKPFFWRAINQEGQTIGVISGFKAGQNFRSRGVWVDPKYRNQGIGRLLMNQNQIKAQDLNLKKIWTMPRKSTWSFYEKLGFQIALEIDKYEFGPHYIATLDLSI